MQAFIQFLTQLTCSENKCKQINSFLPRKSSNVTVCNTMSVEQRVGQGGNLWGLFKVEAGSLGQYEIIKGLEVSM